MKTKETLIRLYDESEARLRENLRKRDILRSKRRPKTRKKFYLNFCASNHEYYRESSALYTEWKREWTRLNKLRQALWSHGIYKQPKSIIYENHI